MANLENRVSATRVLLVFVVRLVTRATTARPASPAALDTQVKPAVFRIMTSQREGQRCHAVCPANRETRDTPVCPEYQVLRVRQATPGVRAGPGLTARRESVGNQAWGAVPGPKASRVPEETPGSRVFRAPGSTEPQGRTASREGRAGRGSPVKCWGRRPALRAGPAPRGPLEIRAYQATLGCQEDQVFLVATASPEPRASEARTVTPERSAFPDPPPTPAWAGLPDFRVHPAAKDSRAPQAVKVSPV